MQKDDFGAKFAASAPAKFNLSLAIVGKRGDMHDLDMITCPLEKMTDEALFCPCPENTIEIISAFDGFDEARFLSFFAPKYAAILSRFGETGKISLSMGVPLGAGLGGSSAGMVATIKAIQKFRRSKGIDDDIDDGFLLSLGSDVPAMYMGGMLRVQGVGDKLTRIDGEVPSVEVFIAEGGSSSADCYRLYDKMLAAGDIPSPPPPPETLKEALKQLRNDLSLPAEALNPNIRALRERLMSEGKRPVMSGSGSALVVIRD